MAISLGGLVMSGERKKASADIAKEYRKQQKKESKRKGWSSFLGSTGGKLLGTALAGMTGGLAAPLLMAAGTFGGKIAAHELTRGMGADTSKIKGGKFGFGREEAKTLREGLQEQLRASDPTKQRGAFGGELLSAYTSAGMSGELGDTKSFLKGGESSSTFGEALFGKGTEEVYSPLRDPSLVENVLGGEDYMGFPFEQELGPVLGPGLPEELGPILGPQNKAQGGQVLSQEELLMLLALAESQNQKAYDNTPLEEVQQPTIADYFGAQGKTLGGSNTQSLSQMLGR